MRAGKFLRGVSCTALLLSGTALAQTTPALTGDQVTADSGLSEIVVTARRREERAQAVPIAITAFSQNELDQQHIQQLTDLSRAVPSLAVSVGSSDPNSLFSGQVRLRGLAGTEIYFADVPLSNTDASTTTGLTHGIGPGFYYDLDELEVDKGAQGTLFGRPSIGGLIGIQPKRPTNSYDGYLKTTFGDYGDKENEFAVNIPILQDKLLVRVSGQMQQRDGYTHDVQSGADLDNRNYYAWRIGVTFRPTDDIQNYFVYDGYWQDSDGSSYIMKSLNPGFTFSRVALPVLGSIPLTLANGPALSGLQNPATAGATFGQLLAIKAAGGQPSLSFFPTLSQAYALQQSLGPRTVAASFSNDIGKDYFYGFTDIATWDVSDNITVKNVAGARVSKQLSTIDFTYTGLRVIGNAYPGNNHGWDDDSAQYSEELQLQGKSLNGKLDWVLGGFLLFDHPLGYTSEVSNALATSTFFHFHEVERSQAVFAHGVFDLSDYVDNLKFTAGYRYTWDYDSLGEVSTKPVDMTTYTAGVANDCNIALHDINCHSQVDSHFSSYGWNLGLEDQLTPDTLIYVRAGNAYRPGGTNLSVPAPFNQYQPEHVTDVELGVKTDWEFMDVHGRTNADIFHTFYKAIQVQQLATIPSAVPGQPPSVQSVTANAASANLDGVEIEQAFRLPYGIDLTGVASYFHSKYDSYPASFGGGAPGFQYVPLFQFAITPTYHVPIDRSWGEMTVGMTWSWYGHQSTSPIQTEPLNVQPHYENFDIRADWTNILGQPIDAGFFMTNATDNLHYTGVVPLNTSLGFSSVHYNPPRMFGFSLKYRFAAADTAEQVAAAYVPPPAVAPTAAPKSYLVFFDFNKSDLTAQAVTIVDTAARNAGPAKVTQLTVTGHTDTVGSDAYNMRLSRRRAESVAAQLEQDGIPASEIEIVAKGKRDLLVPTADGVKEPQNRRVQIVYGGPTS